MAERAKAKDAKNDEKIHIKNFGIGSFTVSYVFYPLNERYYKAVSIFCKYLLTLPDLVCSRIFASQYFQSNGYAFLRRLNVLQYISFGLSESCKGHKILASSLCKMAYFYQ
jgi:hypothetical protein